MQSVSIIIVNYNAGSLLLDCVSAALASSVPVTVYLVDNHSDDESLVQVKSALADEKRLTIIENARNKGFAAANNIVLRQVDTDYILLLNPDCLLQTDTLERMLEAMKNNPAAGMAGCLVVNPDGSEQRGCRRQLPNLSSGFSKAFRINLAGSISQIDQNRQRLPAHPVEVEAISGAFMLVRRQALDEVGLLDETYFMHCEDLDWAKRFKDKNWKILFVPDVVVMHHQGSCSKGKPIAVEWHKHQGMAHYYDKFLRPGHSWLTRAMVRSGIYLHFALKSISLYFRRQHD